MHTFQIGRCHVYVFIFEDWNLNTYSALHPPLHFHPRLHYLSLSTVLYIVGYQNIHIYTRRENRVHPPQLAKTKPSSAGPCTKPNPNPKCNVMRTNETKRNETNSRTPRVLEM
jgi:hypothetical protein